MLEDGPQRGGPVSGLSDPVAAPFEVLQQRAAAAVIVLGNQDGELSLLGSSGRGLRVRVGRIDWPQAAVVSWGRVSPRR